MEKIRLNEGDIFVSDKAVIFETVLGSCVSVCIWDEKLKVAGMNHYMMPWKAENIEEQRRSGPESINRLIDKILGLGSNLRNLKAKVFGGGNVIKAFSEREGSGKENIRVAREILGYYKIPVIKEYTGHNCGIKVIFYSDTGKAFIEELGNVPLTCKTQ